MYNTESLSERVNQMNRYDTDALSLKGQNKPIYIYNTNVYWKKDDPELIKRNSNDDPNDDVTVGNMIRVFWSPS